MSKHVILVTGASSGFGLMTARALAQAGHIVYASMRETEGRNAPASPRRRTGPRQRARPAHRRARRPVRRSTEAALPKSCRTPVASTSSSTTPDTWCSAPPRPSRRNSSSSNTTSTSSARSGSTARRFRYARSRQGAVGLGRLVLDARRHAAVPGALFRRESGDGRSGGVLLHRTGALGDRDHHHGRRRFHQRHQPLRSRRASRPTKRAWRNTKQAPDAGVAEQALKGLAAASSLSDLVGREQFVEDGRR